MLALGAALTPSAFAQAIPGSAQPGRLEQQFQPQTPPPPVSPTVPIPIPPAPSQVPNTPQFVLHDVTIEGATVEPPAVLRALYAQYIGQPVGADQLGQIEQSITVKYRQDGYILSRAVIDSTNPQTGVVHIEVLEGYIDKVTLDPLDYEVGTKGGILKSILKKIERVCHDGDQPVGDKPCPLNRDELERYLLLANDLPGVKASAVIQPSAGQTGAADLFVTVSEKPYDAYATLDNRGSSYVGPLRFQQSGDVNNVLGLYERTTIKTAESIPFNELYLVTVIEELPLSADGLRLSISVTHSRSRPGDLLRPLDLRAISDGGDVVLSYPWLRTRSENLLLHLDFGTRTTRTHQADAPLFNDATRSIEFGGTYDLADRWLGVNLVNLTVTQGVPVANPTLATNPLSSHPLASPNFTKTNGEISRVQQLFPQWNLLTAAEWQYSWSRLLVSEQFGYGGEQYGRAFDDSEILGDSGVAGKAELQYTPSWAPGLLGWQGGVQSLQFYSFYDIGRAWVNNQPFGPPPPHMSGASTGGGVRYTLTQYLSGYFEIAKPLTRSVEAIAAKGEDGRAPRFFFSIAAKY